MSPKMLSEDIFSPILLTRHFTRIGQCQFLKLLVSLFLIGNVVQNSNQNKELRYKRKQVTASNRLYGLEFVDRLFEHFDDLCLYL